MKIAKVHLENGAIHTLCVPFTTEEEAREICLSGLESITGLPRERLVRITKVEVVHIPDDTNLNAIFGSTLNIQIKKPDGNWWCKECGWFPHPDDGWNGPLPQAWVEHNCSSRMPKCKCGHKKSDHIYEEGACRPGSICECNKFERNESGNS